MRVKEIVDEDFVNYRKPSMFIGTISCDGKCCHEAGIPLSVCQNDAWRSCASVVFSDTQICRRYLSNNITAAIVIGGLEPFEQTEELIEFVATLRKEFHCDDDIVIYTGYYPHEIQKPLSVLEQFPNIIVKFGRYIPNRTHKFDQVLGVTLSSDNQYAVNLSKE